MFILQSDIPKELYNKLNLKEEPLDTLTMSSGDEVTHFTQYEGVAHIVTNTWEELNAMTRDTGIKLITENSSYAPYSTLILSRLNLIEEV